jgi:hypothetical protein
MLAWRKGEKQFSYTPSRGLSSLRELERIIAGYPPAGPRGEAAAEGHSEILEEIRELRGGDGDDPPRQLRP